MGAEKLIYVHNGRGHFTTTLKTRAEDLALLESSGARIKNIGYKYKMSSVLNMLKLPGSAPAAGGRRRTGRKNRKNSKNSRNSRNANNTAALGGRRTRRRHRGRKN
jgi:hypothetical protein